MGVYHTLHNVTGKLYLVICCLTTLRHNKGCDGGSSRLRRPRLFSSLWTSAARV